MATESKTIFYLSLAQVDSAEQEGEGIMSVAAESYRSIILLFSKQFKLQGSTSNLNARLSTKFCFTETAKSETLTF